MTNPPAAAKGGGRDQEIEEDGADFELTLLLSAGQIGKCIG